MTTKKHVSEKETLVQTKSKKNVTIVTNTNLLHPVEYNMAFIALGTSFSQSPYLESDII